ncbi:Recombination repair protein 1 [Araneus ventricosus]|uniref:DNA-(apurinic or apyrimidinic site) endonuclease n=1 Tax=Araneus ventricosus TaxID=182803 RepID=A0A4Y2USI2_ARAVE|nr:Recombination repair protein 1 [Araneus ventricosus]
MCNIHIFLGRGRKKAEVVEDKLEVHDAVADDGIKAKKVGKVTKASKKGVSSEGKSKDFENEVNGSGEPQEKTETEVEQIETNKVASKRRQKPAKTRSKEESAEDEDKEETSKVDEEAIPKALPSKRGRKAAKVQNGVDSTKDKDNHESKTDVEAKDLPRPKRKVRGDVEPPNSVKEQNKPEPEETKAKTTRKTKVQPKEDSVEKEAPSKGPGRKRKNAVEKTESETGKRVKDEKPHEIDETRQLRVALKRNQTLDDMARQHKEYDAQAAEEPKVKDVKGPAKGKGKRAAKADAEDSQPTKKTKENVSKSKGAKKEKDKIPDVTALDFDNESKTADGKPWNLKIATWNVNGLRAWLEKNGMSYLHHEKPDILCIQETKCSDDKLPPEVNVEGYHCYWLAGDKDGYSGVGLLSKEKPISVQYGINMEKHDNEGRVITAEYDEFYLVTTCNQSIQAVTRPSLTTSLERIVAILLENSDVNERISNFSIETRNRLNRASMKSSNRVLQKQQGI